MAFSKFIDGGRGALAALALASSACALLEDAPSQSLAVKLKVTITTLDDGGQPVASAEISLGKRKLGLSDEQGLLVTTLEGQPGSISSLSVKCPTGFASPEKTLDVGIMQLASSSPAPRFEARCTALMHELVLGIRTENGPDLPVMYLGKEVARTDTQGVAHVVVSLPPGETASVQLDTKAKPGLTPQNPSLVFKAGSRDELLLLEQKFNLPKRQPVVRAVSNRPKPL